MGPTVSRSVWVERAASPGLVRSTWARPAASSGSWAWGLLGDGPGHRAPALLAPNFDLSPGDLGWRRGFPGRDLPPTPARCPLPAPPAPFPTPVCLLSPSPPPEPQPWDWDGWKHGGTRAVSFLRAPGSLMVKGSSEPCVEDVRHQLHADPSCDALPNNVRKGRPPPGRRLLCLPTCPQEMAVVPQASPCTVRTAEGPSLFLHAVPPVTLRATCSPSRKPLLLSLRVIWVPRPWSVMVGRHLLVPVSTRKLPSAPGPTRSAPRWVLHSHPQVESPCGGHPPRPGFATCRHTCSHVGLVPIRTDPSARAFLRSSPSHFVLPHLALACPRSPWASDPWPPGPVLPCSGLPAAAGSCLPTGPLTHSSCPPELGGSAFHDPGFLGGNALQEAEA